MIEPDLLVDEIIHQANRLAGEPFSATTPITALSGGNRALMIADTAFLSASPVVLIDEVENAGIDIASGPATAGAQGEDSADGDPRSQPGFDGESASSVSAMAASSRFTPPAAELANLAELEAA